MGWRVVSLGVAAWLACASVASAQPAVGEGSDATCSSAPLFCLAGRTGTSNNPTISSDGNGTIYGSAIADGALNLQATSNADPGTVTILNTPANSAEAETAFTWAPTYTKGNVNSTTVFASFNPTLTNTGFQSDTTYGYRCTGRIINSGSGLLSYADCVRADWTIEVTDGTSLPFAITFDGAPTYKQATANTSLATQGFLSRSTYLTTGAVASVITTAIEFAATPTLTTDNASGKQTITTLIDFQAGDDTNSGAGKEQIGTFVGFDVVNLSPANEDTGTAVAIAFRNQGTDDQNRFAGNTMIGSGGVSTAPAAQLEVWETTDKNEVARFRTTATNSDPNLKIIQTKATAAASSTTNIDLDLTAAAPTDAPCATGAVCIVEARTLCHCTSGSSCTADDGGANISQMTVKNTGGTISLVGAVTTPMASQISGTSLTSLTLSVSAPNARMAVVVPANFGHICHVTYLIQSVTT